MIGKRSGRTDLERVENYVTGFIQRYGHAPTVARVAEALDMTQALVEELVVTSKTVAMTRPLALPEGARWSLGRYTVEKK